LPVRGATAAASKLHIIYIRHRLTPPDNLLSANVEYTPHDGGVRLAVVRLVQAKSLKMAAVFLKEEKICFKMIYYTLYLR